MDNEETLATDLAEHMGSALSTDIQEFQIEAEDIDIPRLNVVQKTSQMDYGVGSLVLDKSHEILPADTQGECIVLRAQKMWREDIPFDEKEMPQIATDRAGMEDIKSESDWPIIEFAEIALLFPQPADSEDTDAYPYPIGDTNYALGKLNVAKDAYRKTYKALATFAAFNRGLPLHSRIWHFESQVMSRGKYSWYIPTLSVTKEPTPEPVVEFANMFQG